MPIRNRNDDGSSTWSRSLVTCWGKVEVASNLSRKGLETLTFTILCTIHAEKTYSPLFSCPRHESTSIEKTSPEDSWMHVDQESREAWLTINRDNIEKKREGQTKIESHTVSNLHEAEIIRIRFFRSGRLYPALLPRSPIFVCFVLVSFCVWSFDDVTVLERERRQCTDGMHSLLFPEAA